MGSSHVGSDAVSILCIEFIEYIILLVYSISKFTYFILVVLIF